MPKCGGILGESRAMPSQTQVRTNNIPFSMFSYFSSYFLFVAESWENGVTEIENKTLEFYAFSDQVMRIPTYLAEQMCGLVNFLCFSYMPSVENTVLFIAVILMAFSIALLLLLVNFSSRFFGGSTLFIF